MSEQRSRRIVVLVVDSTYAVESLSAVLSAAVTPPWKPIPPGENTRTYKQERWDLETTDEFLLERLKRLAPHVHWLSSSIIPPAADTTEGGEDRG